MDRRTQSLKRWAEKTLAREVEMVLISGDASFRKYYRLRDSNDTWVLMDAPPEKESVAQFCHAAGVLAGAGVNVPRIFGSCSDSGCALLDDFGDETYLKALDSRNPEGLYADALGALAAIQALGDAPLPSYSEAMVLDEMRLYPEWYVERHLGHTLSSGQRHVLADSFALIAAQVLAQPRVPVHRDYHSRNLMVVAQGNPGILDFQDAVIGPHSYDLLSLLKDAYVEWPEDRIERWIRAFLKIAPAGEASYSSFRRDFDWVGVQRFLKVAGIFARLSHRDGKDGYLGDLPRVEGYLAQAVARLPELRGLAGVVRECRERRMRQ